MPTTNLYLTAFAQRLCFMCELLCIHKIRLFQPSELSAVKDTVLWNQNCDWISHWSYGISEKPGAVC